MKYDVTFSNTRNRGHMPFINTNQQLKQMTFYYCFKNIHIHTCMKG